LTVYPLEEISFLKRLPRGFTLDDPDTEIKWRILDRLRHVSLGLTLFRAPRGWSSDVASRRVAASITWGWIFGRGSPGPRIAGFMDHNVAFRAEVIRGNPYRTDFGRTCGVPLLYRTLVNKRVKIALQPEQQVAHYFA